MSRLQKLLGVGKGYLERLPPVDVHKLLRIVLMNLPYIVIFYVGNKLAWLYQYCVGDSMIERLMPFKNLNTGTFTNKGIEFETRYQICENLSMNLNYSYLHMEQPVLASPRHKAYAGATFSKGRWSAGTGVQYVAGLYTGVKIGNTGRDRKSVV